MRAGDANGGVLDFLSNLVAPAAAGRPLPGFDMPEADRVRAALSAGYELVNVQDSRSHPTLIELGISRAFLSIAERGSKGVADHMRQWVDFQRDFYVPDGPEISPRLTDALVALKRALKYSISPWTGKPVGTNSSIGPGWFLFQNPGQGFIAGQVCEPAVQAQDTIWIIPAHSKILFVQGAVPPDKVLQNVANLAWNLLTRQPKLSEYLSRDAHEIIVSDWYCEHFGHYVWNVLSAWGAFFKATAKARPNRIVTALTHRYFGPVTDIFPVAAGLNELTITRPDQAYDLIFDNNVLLMTISSGFLTSDTSAHVVRHSLKRCDATFSARLAQLRAQHWPVVLFSLRSDNRCWVDQLDGFADLARRLQQDFPAIGFVIHGLSDGVSMGWTTSWMSLDAEAAASAQLEAEIATHAQVINAVGLTIHESVAISESCDAFVAPVGSGMALYKWLTNKPGVAFTNRFCTEVTKPGRWPFAVFDKCREGNIQATYVPLDAVTDTEAEHHGAPSRANFTLDRTMLHATVRDLLRALPARMID